MEYGTATVAMHIDALKSGSRVLLIDALLATGGTAALAATLVQKVGAEILEISFLIEPAFLNGRQRLTGLPVPSPVVLILRPQYANLIIRSSYAEMRARFICENAGNQLRHGVINLILPRSTSRAFWSVANAELRFVIFVALLVCTVHLTAQIMPGTPLWTYDAADQLNGSPALALEGTAYVAGGLSVYAITNVGSAASNKWVAALPSSLNPYSSPTIGADGAVYVAGGDGVLCAISPGGVQKWTYPSVATACPAVGFDSTVYVQGRSSYLFALLPNGTLRWSGSGGGGPDAYSSAVIGTDVSVFIVSSFPNLLHALDPQGNQKWTSPPFDTAYAISGESPAIGADGTLFVNAQGGVYAFSPSGTPLWTNTDPRNVGVGPSSSLAVGKDGTIYVAAIANSMDSGYGFRLYAISSAGSTKWVVTTNIFGNYGARLGTPAVDAAGTILLAAYTQLFAFAPNGTVEWVFNAGGNPGDTSAYSYTSPAIGPDGTIYATFGNRLYALFGTNALADAPWPMYRQNPRHTGKVERPSLLNPLTLNNGNFVFQFFGQISNTFTVQASTNLSDWASVTNFAVTNVPMDVIDLDATNFPLRFYRAVSDAPL